MKKIVRNLMFGLLLLCTGVVATSCSDDPDAAMDTIPYDRVLTPLNFEAEVVASVGTDIEFSWSPMDNADGYILQLFEAVGEEGLAPDYDLATPVKEYDVAPDQIPFVATNLEVDKTFWARVQAYSSKIGDSKWAELVESVSTSAVRKSLNPVVVSRTVSSVTLAWDNADDKGDLNSIQIEKVQPAEGDVPALYTLSAEELEAASAELADLEACTNYKFTLLFGKSGKRGVTTAWTRPSTEGLNEVNSVEGIYNAVNGATGDVKLYVKYNEAGYDMSSVILDLNLGLKVDCNLTMVGETSEDGKKPAIYNLQFTMGAGSTYIHLEDLYFDSNNKCGTLMQNDAAQLTAMEVVNCEICNYQKAIYSVASSGTSNVGKIHYTGVYVHDVNATGSAGGDFIDLRAGKTDEVLIENSTFYAAARTFFRASDNAKLGTATIQNCTFNYVTSTLTSSNNAGIFHVRVATEAQGLFMTKNVFLNEYNDAEPADGGWVRIARNSTDSYAPTCSGNIYYNVGPAWWVSKAYLVGTETSFTEADGMVDGMMLENDPCVNSAAGKLYLADPVIAENKAGDPRWWDAVEPVVVRATELEVVTEPKIWDFTEKTIFQTETIEGNTIIDNIKIYGPAELVMSEGLTFTEAGVMDAKPLSGALHFKAEGYGAVVISTADAGYNGSVQVIAGEDRYTVQADGVPHKVLFGDLQGVNDIYVLAGSAVQILSVEWTQDLTPDATAEVLATPVVLFDVSSVDEGTEQAITASWKAVENAATYEVTFNNVTVEQSELSFTLDAATVAALPVGEYVISVVAKPVETSSKYVKSEAGEAKLKIKEVILGGEVTNTWDFASDAWAAIVSEVAAKGSDGSTDLDVTIDGLNIVAGGKNIRANESGYFQPNGAGSTTTRVFKFEAPASGTLKVKVSNTGSSEDMARMVCVQTGDDASTLQEQAGGSPAEAPLVLSYDIEVSAPTTVYVYPSKGLRFYSLEYTYISAGGPQETVWDISTIFTANLDPLVAADEKSVYVLNEDGSKTDVGVENATATETLYLMGNGKKIKVNHYTTNDGTELSAFNFGGGDAFAFINVDKPGTLTVVAAQGKSVADGSNCKLGVYVGGPHKDLGGYTAGTLVGEQVELPGYDKSLSTNGAATYEFEITDVTAKTMVAITKPGGATSPDIYKVVWTPAN